MGICLNTGGSWNLRGGTAEYFTVLSQEQMACYWETSCVDWGWGRGEEGEGTCIPLPGEQPTSQRKIPVAPTSSVHPCSSFRLEFLSAQSRFILILQIAAQMSPSLSTLSKIGPLLWLPLSLHLTLFRTFIHCCSPESSPDSNTSS